MPERLLRAGASRIGEKRAQAARAYPEIQLAKAVWPLSMDKPFYGHSLKACERLSVKAVCRVLGYAPGELPDAQGLPLSAAMSPYSVRGSIKLSSSAPSKSLMLVV
jgi:hypothetical protein